MRTDWDDDLSILSAENVNFGVETAGLGSRFAAVLIDMTLQVLAFTLLLLAAAIFSIYLPPANEWLQWMRSLGGALVVLLIFAIFYVYFFLFEWLMDGQTPGKRWLHLRVLQANGMPLTMWGALLRNLLRIADFLPFLYGAGALVAVLNPHNRRVGDLVAGTIVARERHDAGRALVLDIDTAADNFLAAFAAPLLSSPLPAAPTETAPALATAPAATASVTTADAILGGMATATALGMDEAFLLGLRARLDEQDYELTADFLRRRDSLPTITRERLARSLVARLCHKLGAAPPAPGELEPFLENVARAFRL